MSRGLSRFKEENVEEEKHAEYFILKREKNQFLFGQSRVRKIDEVIKLSFPLQLHVQLAHSFKKCLYYDNLYIYMQQ